MAMGANEAANQAVGGSVRSNERIDLIMKPIGDHPVLWLTVKTRKTRGPYANREMRKWNAALLDGCRRYPNMRVYDWAGQVDDSWFINDGIHFTTHGYAERGKRIAEALATAFPKDGRSQRVPDQAMIQCHDQIERQKQGAALQFGRLPVLGIDWVGDSERNRVPQIVVIVLQVTGARPGSTDERFSLEFGFGARLVAWIGFAIAYFVLGLRAFSRCDRAELVRRVLGKAVAVITSQAVAARRRRRWCGLAGCHRGDCFRDDSHRIVQP